MAVYEFEDIATGERVEREYPLGRAPRVGRVITIRGRKLRRLLSTGAGLDVRDYEHVALGLPAEFAKHCPYQTRGKDGEIHGAARTKAQIREIEKRTGWEYRR